MAERPTRTAEFATRCLGCDESIEPGETIALDEPDGVWMHEECADEEGPWPEEDE